MRGHEVRLRPATANTDNRKQLLIAVAIADRDRSIEAKFNLEAYRILTTLNSRCDRRVERHCLPSKNYALRILDRVDIVAVTFVGT